MKIIWWLATVGAIGLISIFLSERQALDPVQNLTLTASAPLESTFRDAASPVNDIYEGIADRGDLVKENERLRQELEALQSQVAGQEDAQARIRELEDALGVKQTRPDDQLLAANVIAQEPSGMKRMLAIDRGSGDGLDEGMVILSRTGSLVGTVARVHDDYAWIRLITDADSAVNAEVNLGGASVLTANQASPTPGPTTTPVAPPADEPVTSVRGVAEGTLREEVLLDLLPPEVSITEGALVVTSGLGGNYPPGLLIGSVTEVEARPQSAFKRASLAPAADLSELETVLILVNFRPARLVSP